jgi:hypothetical protein
MRSDVAVPWCGLLRQRGVDRGDTLPHVRMVKRAAVLLVLGKVYACVPHPGWRTTCVFPPLVLFLAAKAVGGWGHHTLQGQVVGEVEEGLVWLKGEESS